LPRSFSSVRANGIAAIRATDRFRGHGIAIGKLICCTSLQNENGVLSISQPWVGCRDQPTAEECKSPVFRDFRERIYPAVYSMSQAEGLGVLGVHFLERL
jgi:hypothetical protein